MLARGYFAWRLAVEADHEERQELLVKRRRSKYVRRSSRISDTRIVQRNRLTKFVFLCENFRENTNLRNSQRISLETKVLSALLFYANGDYQRVVGIANSLSQEAISHYIHQVGSPEIPAPIQEVAKVDCIVAEWNKPGEGGQSGSTFEVEMVDVSATSPTPHHAQCPQRHTEPRRAIRRRRRLLRSPAPAPPYSARRAPRKHFNATKQFLHSNKPWRNLETKFDTEHVRLRERELQLRDVELQQQSQWQTLFAKLNNVLDIIANKINSK